MNDMEAPKEPREGGTHQRPMTFVRGFVTCTNCAACYDVTRPREKTFCQPYSRPVDPYATEHNIAVAERCAQWVPDGVDRSMVVVPPHEYWYDD